MIRDIEMFEKEQPKEPSLEREGTEELRTQSAGDIPSMDSGDGMKTNQEIKGYDPIANPINDPLQNKQGVGQCGYDYSDFEHACDYD